MNTDDRLELPAGDASSVARGLRESSANDDWGLAITVC